MNIVINLQNRILSDSTLEDPRQQAKVRYPLDEILLLCLCGVLSCCEKFVDIVEYEWKN
ncbi:MAG: transposase family protein [Hyphomicrobiales bacterium]|nr:transposase family protein [Hyphomicrobiales bacterium]